jgi:hypothetical protein
MDEKEVVPVRNPTRHACALVLALAAGLPAGNLADLIVLDRNLFSIEPSEISEAKVLLTLLEGEPVHGDLSL